MLLASLWGFPEVPTTVCMVLSPQLRSFSEALSAPPVNQNGGVGVVAGLLALISASWQAQLQILQQARPLAARQLTSRLS